MTLKAKRKLQRKFNGNPPWDGAVPSPESGAVTGDHPVAPPKAPLWGRAGPGGQIPARDTSRAPLLIVAVARAVPAEPYLSSDIMPQQCWDSATPVGGSPRVLPQLSVGVMPSGHLSSFLLSWELEAGQ